jgi:zinc protease
MALANAFVPRAARYAVIAFSLNASAHAPMTTSREPKRRMGGARMGRRRCALFAAGLLLAVCATLARSQETDAVTATISSIIPFPTTTTTLPNGLRVVVLQMPSNGIVSFWTIVRTGSRDEYETGRTGFAHFFEHMMFRGTERFPADQYNHVLTRIGANANAYTTDDHTAYHITMAAEDLEQVVELESDRYQNQSYAEDAFQTEAGAVYGEYRKSRTDPDYALYEPLMAAAFTVHPYGHLTLGLERDIALMPTLYEYSKAFFARYYRPDNTVLLITGDVTPERVLPLVERYYADWRPGYVPPEIPAEPEQHVERRISVTYDGQTLPLVWIAYKVPQFAADDHTRVAVDLLGDLAFGETSDAYRRLVLEEQVVEHIDAGADDSRDPKTFEISARVKDPANIAHVLEVIDATVAGYRAAPPDSKRLAALKQRLRYGFLMGLQTPEGVAYRLAHFIALSGDLSALQRLYASYETVTPADVQQAARQYLAAERRTVGVLRARQ